MTKVTLIKVKTLFLIMMMNYNLILFNLVINLNIKKINFIIFIQGCSPPPEIVQLCTIRKI